MRYLSVSALSITTLLKNYFTDTADDDVFIVIIGANSQQLDDFLSPYLTLKNLTGLLVEPLKDIFDSLLAGYHGRTNLHFENSAITKRNGAKNFYRVNKDLANSAWTKGLGSLSKSVIEAHQNQLENIDRMIVKEKVNGISFSSLIEKYSISHINVLQIDTEGYDFEIIKTINFEQLKPDIIIAEYLHLTLYQYYVCVEYLDEKNYLVYKNTDSFDFVAIKMDLV